MEIDAIYFDMDGVLVDFARGQRELLGIEPVDQGKKKREDDDRLFQKMRERDHFYLELEPIPGSIELFALVREMYGERCRILTGIPKESRGIINASLDKRQWVRKHIGEDVEVNTVLRKEKAGFVRGKGSLLIDDFSLNINEWRERGGTGILFTDPRSTMEKLKKMGIL